MSDSFARLVAIVVADFRIRFRRVSTWVVFLLLSAFAYVWIPAPSTGRALIQINGQRAINNSGAIGLGTASLGMIFVGLFGFYFISNTIRRDISTRCGVVAASTPMSSFEYLLGKFFGNLAFLVTFLGGFMLSSMAMLLIRGEAPFEPGVFIAQYLLLTPSAMVFVSAAAVFFESVPLLAGKLGDVLYFFFWIGVIGLVVANETSHGRINWTRSFDFTGFGFMIGRMQETLHTDSVAIGASPFDPTKPPILFPGLTITRNWLLPRLISTCAPLILLPLAALFFHRFDPVRTGRISGKGGRKWLGKLQNLFKPMSRRAVALIPTVGPGGSFLGAMWADALLTFSLYPLAFVAFVVVTIVAVAAPLSGSWPVIFAVLAIILSDVSTRDFRAGTTASLRSIGRLREAYVWWKVGSALLLSLLFCAAPIVRTFSRGPLALAALLAGIFFVAALATALGIVSANSKTFIVVFLTFWYLVLNDHGQNPWFDFAGLYGHQSSATILSYLAIGLAAIAFAQAFYRSRLARA